MDAMTCGIRWWLLMALAVLVQADGGDDDEMRLSDVVSALEPFAEGCEPAPSREHIVQLARNDENSEYPSKCFRRCLFERFQLLEEEQLELVKTKAVEMMSMMWQDRDTELEDIVELCNTESASITDKCENAHSIGMCSLRELRERGFDVPDLKD